MADLLDGVLRAFWLLVTLDSDLVEITLRSLRVTLTALVVAS
jgi:tungstate transport system permease protein